MDPNPNPFSRPVPPIIPARPRVPPPLPRMVGRLAVPPAPLPAIPQRSVQPPKIATVAASIKARLAGPKAEPKRQTILSPHELDRFRNLLVFARLTVEGYFSGKHKSPYHGSSAEFAEYKEYAPGDDVGNLDWRVYGRTRRLFLKQYEAETDMVVYLMVDTSASMSYAGKGRQSKYLLAAKTAAALAYLMMHQSDKAALAMFADKVTQYHPPGSTRRHLHNVVTELERVEPRSTTGMAEAVAECANLFHKRGVVVILSDFFTDYGPLFDALGQFMHRKFQLLLLQVLDPDELELPSINVARFVDLETKEEVRAEPEEIRVAYRENMKKRLAELAFQADQRQIQHAVVHTDRPYLDAIEAYLGFRGEKGARK
jgi:uncharacterized protein (DUF58 family)